MNIDQGLQRLWYGPAWRSLPLWPLAVLFRLLVGLRSLLYRARFLQTRHVGVPVVVVGNITVGGTGKTPVAGWLAKELSLRGHRVGVVLRGYGGAHRGAPRLVTAEDDPRDTGDEAVVHARRGAYVVVIGADRVRASERAVAEGVQVIVCDDGLQHARLARDYEIAVVDGERGLGNGWLLPAGPLREPASRLETVNAVIFTSRDGADGQVDERSGQLALRGPLQLTAHLRPGKAVNLLSGKRRELATFTGIQNLHTVAGIGHPQAFFAGLRAAGLRCEEHSLPDHGRLDRQALPFDASATVLMTEKDAVKCQSFAQPDWWWIELEVYIERDAARTLLTTVLERTGLTGAGVALG